MHDKGGTWTWDSLCRQCAYTDPLFMYEYFQISSEWVDCDGAFGEIINSVREETSVYDSSSASL